MRKIAFYGKGGIGKSTTVSHLASALTLLGRKVLQIGCDPKADSNILHFHGERIKTVLDCLRDGQDSKEDLLHKGEDGVYGIECGGPLPGTGCAGRGIIAAFEKIEELEILEDLQPDYVLYDVLGDVVCGGFALPIKKGYAKEVYIVTSGEMMSLFAASNIMKAIENTTRKEQAVFKGWIVNRKNIENEDWILEKASKELHAPIFFSLPRSPRIQEAEKAKKTLLSLDKEDPLSQLYLDLARRIDNA